MSNPKLHALKLEPCCHKALNDIKFKQEAGRDLRRVLIAGPFATLFGANPVDMLYTIASTDWGMLTKAAKAVNPIVRNRCRTIAELHSLDHPGGQLNRFWTSLAKSFQ